MTSLQILIVTAFPLVIAFGLLVHSFASLAFRQAGYSEGGEK
ncbi:hypothetical protein [Agrobacterium rubi]|nr:hypothetical protein [Agrobacterium rubi]